MADIGPKRIAEFIDPFRVEPGRRVRLPHDFDPSGTRQVKVREAKAILAQGVQHAGRVPDAARGAGHLRRRRGAPGDGRGRQGRDDPPRHERRQPAGRPGQQLQGPVERGPRPRLPVAVPGSSPSAATSGSSTARTTRRSSSSGSIPQILANQKIPPQLKDRGIWKRRFREINDWERYLTDQGYRFVKLFLNLSKEEQRRRFLSRIDEPGRTGSSAPTTPRNGPYWDDYQKAFSEVLSNTSTAVGALVRHPGRRQAVRPGRRGRRPGQRAHRDRPALPEGQRPRPARRSRRPRSTSWARRPTGAAAGSRSRPSWRRANGAPRRSRSKVGNEGR